MHSVIMAELAGYYIGIILAYILSVVNLYPFMHELS